MGSNDGSVNVLIQVQLVPDSSTEAPASRIPGAVGAVAITPAAVAALFAADDGARSIYNDPAVLRAGGAGEASTGVAVPGTGVDSYTALDTDGADGGSD